MSLVIIHVSKSYSRTKRQLLNRSKGIACEYQISRGSRMQFKQEPSGPWGRWHYQLPWIIVSGSRLPLFRASDLTFSFWFPCWPLVPRWGTVTPELFRWKILEGISRRHSQCHLRTLPGSWPLGCVNTPLLWPLIVACHMVQIKTTMKRNGARTPPLRTPVVASKLSDIRPSTKTAVFGTVTQESDCTNDLNSMT